VLQQERTPSHTSQTADMMKISLGIQQARPATEKRLF
jgi:hypothetical protein